jgi:hypothetical protein
MKTQIIALILLFLGVVSCATKPIPSSFKEKYTINKFIKGDNGISEKLNINGYYVMFYKDIPVNMIFFDDNTFASGFFFKDNLSEQDIQQNLKINVTQYDNSPKVGYWGGYKFEGDTLIAQYLSHASLLAPWVFSEECYKFINDTTIRLIYIKELINDRYYYFDSGVDSLDVKYSLAHFHQADSLFSSDNWLKEEKWMWKNEEDWEEYMDARLIKRKKKKSK